MGLLDTLRGGTRDTLSESERDGYEATISLLEADYASLERALDEPGWRRIAVSAEHEFTRDGIRRISELCRVLRAKNPLLRRASALKCYYVFGQGVEVSSDDEDVNDTVRALIEDPSNQRAVFGAEARERLERSLHTDANLFLACWSHPRTGRVQVRPIPFDEVEDVVRNPDDAAEPWFHVRRWWQVTQDPATGQGRSELKEALYPDIDYRPRTRPHAVNGMEVRWESPVLHVATNRDGNAKFGVPELYPALDWVRAHTDFLEDWRRVVRALSKFVWQKKAKGSRQQSVRERMRQATADDAPTAQTAVSDHGDGDLTPIPKSDATLTVGDHRAFALMVSAATDIPETMLLGDPSTGNLATATTLDRPTELAFATRQELWASVYRRLARHAVERSVMTPAGGLSGRVERDEWGRLRVTMPDGEEPTVDVDWPPVTEHDVAQVAKAVKDAVEAGALPPRQAVKVALGAFGVDDADEVLDELEADGFFDAPEAETEEMVEAVRGLREAVAGIGSGA